MDNYDPMGERFIEYAESGFINGLMDLIEKGVNVNYQNNSGETALMKASSDYGNLPLVKLLLDSGADPNLQNDYGVTALMKASNYYTYITGNLSLVKLLLDSGAYPNFTDENGITALIEATNYGNLSLVKLLLDSGADPNIGRDKHDGKTAYDLALNTGNIEIIKLLKKYTMIYKMQHKRHRNLTYRKKRTQLAYKNLVLSKLLDTYDVDEQLTRQMRRETIRSIFG